MPGMLRAPLRRLIELWTEVRLAEPTPDKLALDPQLPTLYVLPRPSLSDALLLDSYCQRHGLPPARGRLALPDRPTLGHPSAVLANTQTSARGVLRRRSRSRCSTGG